MLALNDPTPAIGYPTAQPPPTPGPARAESARPVEAAEKPGLRSDNPEPDRYDGPAVVQLVRGAKRSFDDARQTLDERRAALRARNDERVEAEQARRARSDERLRAERSAPRSEPAADTRPSQEEPAGEPLRVDEHAPPDQQPPDELLKRSLARSIAARFGEQDHIDLYI